MMRVDEFIDISSRAETPEELLGHFRTAVGEYGRNKLLLEGKNMSDIFISYSRKDIAYARLLHKALKEHDLETWIDWQDMADSYVDIAWKAG